MYRRAESRIGLLLLTIIAAVRAMTPDAQLYAAIPDAPEIAVIIIIMASVGLADTFVNDLLPERFSFLGALKIRHVVLLCCAAFFGIVCLLSTVVYVPTHLVVQMLTLGIWIAIHAFFDLIRREGKSDGAS
jgi:hypothetical protein